MDACKRSDETVTLRPLQSELTCEVHVGLLFPTQHKSQSHGSHKEQYKEQWGKWPSLCSCWAGSLWLQHLSAEVSVETLRGTADDFSSALRGRETVTEERETRVWRQGERALQWFIHFFIFVAVAKSTHLTTCCWFFLFTEVIMNDNHYILNI